MEPCNSCKNSIKCASLKYCIKSKKSLTFKVKSGKIQLTDMKEKNIALLRDGYKCIYCKNANNLQFHHVFWKPLERKYNDERRNCAENGVILCAKCHQLLTDGSKLLDLFARGYLERINKFYDYKKIIKNKRDWYI